MIAIDAMGGDFAPRSVVQGALQAARKNIKVGLYGDQVQLFSLLYEFDLNWEKLPIEVVHCSQVVEMTDIASKGILKKKDSSLVRALTDLSQGAVQAVVSAGNSGAVLVGSVLLVGRIAGIERPAIGHFIPNAQGHQTFCIDLGANTDCRPEQLVQFAIMGNVYTKMLQHITSPRIGLLSNGHESCKGSHLVKETFALLESYPELNFIGNVEPIDLFNGRIDVLVSDGFSGNIMLKTAEGMHKAILESIEQAYQGSIWRSLLGFFNQKIFSSLHDQFDNNRLGGALLLGVNAPVIVAHGNANAWAIENAIKFAYKKTKTNFINRFIPPVIEHLKNHTLIVSEMNAKNLHSTIKFDRSV